MIIKQYMSKPIYVEAVQVTQENWREVMEWCGGATASGNRWIVFQVKDYVYGMIPVLFGDWVVRYDDPKVAWRGLSDGAFRYYYQVTVNGD